MESHLRYLGRRYHFVTLDQIVDAIRSRKLQELPKNSVAVTLDDGHAGNARLARIFRTHSVRPTIYICSQVVGTHRKFWFGAGAEGQQALKHLANSERQRRLEAIGFREDREYLDELPQALSKSDLEELCSWADVGSHSRFHPILTTCSDSECRREIVESKREVEAISGRECRHFAFPNGDYSERELVLVREAGYESARTVDVGWNGRDADVYRLRILGIADDASTNVLAAQLSGLAMYVRYGLRGSWNGRSRKIRLGQTR